MDDLAKTFYIFQEFDEDLARDFVEWLKGLDKLESTELEIIINSPGGSLYALQTILDFMRVSKHSFRTIATGVAASCAFILLMNGDERYVFEGTTLMSHQYSWGVKGKHHELSETSKQFEVTYNWIRNLYKRCSTKRLSKATLDKLLGPTDFYVTEKQMKDWGLIDGIL